MELVDLKTLAEKTSIPVPTLRRFLKMGMPYYRPSRKIYVNLNEFYIWFKNSFLVSGKLESKNLDQLMEDAIASIN